MIVAVAATGDSGGGHPQALLGTATNAAVGRSIVVDARGRTLYSISPETPRHLLCKGACLHTWVPLTVVSPDTKLVAGSGIQGRMRILPRPGGRLQVTLRGLPLYRFSGDRSRGQARGNGKHSFGGAWEVVPPRAPKLPPTPRPAAPGPVPGPKLPPTPPPA